MGGVLERISLSNQVRQTVRRWANPAAAVWQDRRVNQSSPDPRLAASAAAAKPNRAVKNPWLCPLNSPDWVSPVAAATAPPLAVDVGRITAQSGRFAWMNLQGLAITWFVSSGLAASIPVGVWSGACGSSGNSVPVARPCKFIHANLPLCAVIRPTSTAKGGAVAAVTGLTQSGLFNGQSQGFFKTLLALAEAADEARRGFGED